MATKEEKKVAKKEENLPAAIDFAADAGAGFEDSDKDSFAIPFLSILQSGSPQCKRSDGAYIPGAQEGMMFNSVTNEVIDGDKGILVIPAYYNRNFIEWIPRGEGGGIAGVHTVPEADELSKTLRTITVVDNGKEKEVQVLDNGNTLSDTRNHYLLIVNEDGSTSPVVCGMSSSQIKESKKWMTMMQGIKINGVEAPMMSQIYRITTVPKSNNEGSWYGFKIDHVEQIKDATQYQDAKKFRELIKSGAAEIDKQAGSSNPSGSDSDEM